MRSPYGILSFYGPVVVGVLAIWILFLFIAKVIITASKTKAKQKGDSDLVLRRVCDYVNKKALLNFAVIFSA